MKTDNSLKIASLAPALDRFFSLADAKLRRLAKRWNPVDGSPVFTVKGQYTSQGWTEWTQGFQFGCQLLQFDATDDAEMLALGRENTRRYMAPHLTHVGVHDHGFNNVSTYGNLRRLTLEGKTGDSADALEMYELALKLSGAVQAARWTTIADGTGFIHSFNGPHSLFSDTVRSCRALMLGHALGHVLMGENDRRFSLLGRALEHMHNTMKFNVYFGKGRDIYDERGRVVHESIFNTNDGAYRCPSSQQGYSPFTTWTRGHSWVLCGFAEELEFLATLKNEELKPHGGRKEVEKWVLETARATADFYLANTSLDGIPYWDTGAPGLAHMPDWRERDAQPDNPHEPVDSSAAAISAQGLLRLGHYLGATKAGKAYWQAGLTVARTLLDARYISQDPHHEGLLLHAQYHRPRGWDHVPRGKKIPLGEACMWGDYHAMELAVYLKRVIQDEPYLTFYGEL